MDHSVKYVCSCCGKEHEEWPALTFKSPDSYSILPDKQKDEIAEIDSDFCVIKHLEQTDRFIRCTLTQKVIDYCEDLEYGLWVSLSEKSFQDYSDNYNNENHETTYFGWLCNDIPEYEYQESIPTNVITKTGNQRPEIVPHESCNHPFVHDYYNGITQAEAEKRIQSMIACTEKKDIKGPWWKFW